MFDINYCKESNTPYIVFNDIECVFRKSEINSYLVLCETEKNEKMLKNYVKIINEIKDQVLFIVDDDFLLMSKDLMSFKFKTNDDLPYNRKINVKVCVISINSVFEEGNWYYRQIELQDCFYENSDYFVKN